MVSPLFSFRSSSSFMSRIDRKCCLPVPRGETWARWVVNRKEASNAKRWRAWEHQRCWCRQTSLAGVVYRIRNEILLFLNAYLDVNETNAPLDEDDRSGGSGRGFGAGSPSCAKFMGINRLEGKSPSRPWTLLFGPCERFTNNQPVTKKIIMKYIISCLNVGTIDICI